MNTTTITGNVICRQIDITPLSKPKGRKFTLPVEIGKEKKKAELILFSRKQIAEDHEKYTLFFIGKITIDGVSKYCSGVYQEKVKKDEGDWSIIMLDWTTMDYIQK